MSNGDEIGFEKRWPFTTSTTWAIGMRSAPKVNERTMLTTPRITSAIVSGIAGTRLNLLLLLLITFQTFSIKGYLVSAGAVYDFAYFLIRVPLARTHQQNSADRFSDSDHPATAPSQVSPAAATAPSPLPLRVGLGIEPKFPCSLVQATLNRSLFN